MTNTTLHNCGKLEVRLSPVEGFGVFATDEIKAGEILEEIPFILFPHYQGHFKNLFSFLDAQGIVSDQEKYIDNLRANLKFKEPEKYYFKWFPSNSMLDGQQISYQVLPLGFGPIYNTANTQNNAGWKIKEKTFVFIAEKDIQKDEEIRTFYGYFLGEDGTVFSTLSTFFLGVESEQGRKPILKSLRTANEDEFNTINNDYNYSLLKALLQSSTNGLYLHTIQSIEPDGQTIKYSYEFPNGLSTKFTYQKIQEFKNCKLPFTKFLVSYTDKEGKEQCGSFILKNR